MKAHSEEIKQMGVDPSKIGVHSIRKGAAAYVCNGTTSTVSFAAVCQRAGWTMGDVKDRYIHHDAAGDHVVGRVVSGLDVNSHHYSISPPVFKDNVDLQAVNRAINVVFPDSSGSEQQSLYRNLLAALIYHHAHHEKVLRPQNRYRNSQMFRTTDQSMSDMYGTTRVCYPWDNLNNSIWRVTFTGLTSTAILFKYFQLQLLKFDNLQKDMPERVAAAVTKVMEERNIGGSMNPGHNSEKLVEIVCNQIAKQFGHLALKPSGATDDDKPQKPAKVMVKPKVPFTLPTLQMNYVIKTNPSPLQIWICWWHGEECRSSAGTVYQTPPL